MVSSRLNVIGDSQFVRFINFSRHSKSELQINPTVTVSGATVNQVRSIIKSSNATKTSPEPYAIFLATNDLKTGSTVADIQKQYLALIRLVRRVFCPSILVLVAIPVYPKYSRNREVLDKIERFNAFLYTLQRSNATIVIKWPSPSPFSFFTRKYPQGRIDLIHLSNEGFQYLGNEIKLILK